MANGILPGENHDARSYLWVIMVWFVFCSRRSAGLSLGNMLCLAALLHFILFLLLGWQVYGPPVKE